MSNELGPKLGPKLDSLWWLLAFLLFVICDRGCVIESRLKAIQNTIESTVEKSP